MTRTRTASPLAGAALVAGLLALTVATAQDGNPLDRGPRAPPADTGEPGWVGLFADASGELIMVLYATQGDGFEGMLVEQARERGVMKEHAVRGVVRGRALEGTLGEQAWAFTGSVDPDGALVLVSGKTTTAMRRMPGAPRSSDELRQLVGGQRQARAHGNEAAAIGALKTINTAQVLFREGDKENDGTLDYGTLAELGQTDLIDTVLAGGEKQGYRFECRPAPATPEFLWMATASPLEPGVTGTRYFVMNHAGVIYYSTRAPFALNDDCRIPDDATPLGREERGPGGGVPSAPEPRQPGAGAADVSHVKAGQRYVFTMTNPGAPPMEMRYEVDEVAVGADGVTVRYRIQTLMDLGQGLQPVGDPVPQEWSYQATGFETPELGPNMTREKVVVSGIEFDCMVSTTGNSKVWIPAPGGVPTFPGVVRLVTDGATVMELTKVE